MTAVVYVFYCTECKKEVRSLTFPKPVCLCPRCGTQLDFKYEDDGA